MLIHAEHDFHGGIHPPENKTQSLALPLGRPSLPERLILPLGQHIGQASRPLVNIGNKVLKGQAIAVSNGAFSSFLHAPTSGEILDISHQAVPHPSGLAEVCIILKPDGAETWDTLNPLVDWQTKPVEEVIGYLAKMGIVGMGGAGFPTQVKLSGASKASIDELIINAAECEPYITSDDMLIREKSQQLIKGILVLQHLIQAKKVLIGIEDNKPTAIQTLQTAIAEIKAETKSEISTDITLVVMPTKYPSGGEKQLIQLLTGKEVPNKQLPADIGVICQNVGTCVAIYDAIYHGQPLISRITTLTGDAIGQAQNVDVLLGTPIQHLMQYADLDKNKLERLVIGGPMMGFTITNTHIPITKTTNCVLAASRQELAQPEPEQACIRCGMCEQVCPASLLPQQLLWFSKSQEHDKAEHHNLFDCIECGACSYVCPSSIPLVQYYRHSKSTIREARETTIKSDHAKLRFEARQARIEAEVAEKEAKRQASRARVNANIGTQSVPENTAAANKTQAAEAPSAEQIAVKKLKIDIAIANTKLKKTQKNLAETQESGDTEATNTLQLQVDEYLISIKELEHDMAQKAAALANSNIAPKPASAQPSVTSDELKKAKVSLVIATTTLKKVQKQLADDPDNAELQQKEQAQQATIKAAEKTLSALNNTSAPTSPPVMTDELKKAKISVAIATTHLKKIQAKLAQEPENTELQERVTARAATLTEAEDTLAKMKVDSSASTTINTEQTNTAQVNKPVIADSLKKAKIDLAMAKATTKKLEKAIQKAEEYELEELDSLRVQHKEGLSRIEQLEETLTNVTHAGQIENGADAQIVSKSMNKETFAEQKKTIVADPEKQLKINHALAKAALNKTNRAIQMMEKDGANDEAIATAGLLEQRQDNEAKLAEVESKLNGGLTLKAEQERLEQRGSLTQPVPTAKPKETEHLPEIPSFDDISPEEHTTEVKKQKIAAAIEKAKISKLQRQLNNEENAIDKEKRKSILTEIEEARFRQKTAELTLAKLHDILNDLPKETETN